MFITIEDLGDKIYEYQIDEITEGDDSIILHALQAAVEEVRGYLTENNKRNYIDGRLHYDVSHIFAETGDSRNPLLLTHVLTVAKWYLVELCNADIIYEMAKERYDRAIAFLKKVSKGEVNISGLPLVQVDEDTAEPPFRFGSRQKFNHEH